MQFYGMWAFNLRGAMEVGCCLQLLWPRMLLKKWLNVRDVDDFSADELSADDDEPEDTETESESECESSSQDTKVATPCSHTTRSLSSLLPRKDDETLRRHPDTTQSSQSATFEREFLNTKELRIAVGTWNVAGRTPPPHLDLKDWLESNGPADIYVLGFQEIVPLNAGNVFGAEDNGPAIDWQALIRETLNRLGVKRKCRCYSAPSSPSREMTSDTSDDAFLESSEVDAKWILIDEETSLIPLRTSSSTIKEECVDQTMGNVKQNLVEVYRSTERSGLPSSHHQRTKSEPMKWLSSGDLPENGGITEDEALVRPLLSPISRVLSTLTNPVKNKARYVRIASKQMVGIHISVWVLRKLRRYIHNLSVSCVGLGLMGCLGNKGSISVSMMLHQTSFCFICTHLTSGDKDGDEAHRNSDVTEILKRTRFPPTKAANTDVPKTIWGHDRIIWLGDLNYRLNLMDNEIRFLVAREDWTALFREDQLRKQSLKGHIFEGWCEGTISFAPTYKYEFNSDRYAGENAKSGEKRRSPAWCDRILWHGKGLRQLSYKRGELTISDHRPVIAVFIAEVEMFMEHKIKKTITFQTCNNEY